MVPSITLWYPSLNEVVRCFGTNHELNSSKGIITSHFGFTVDHDVPIVGLDKVTITSSFRKIP